MAKRPAIPADLRRAILVEAGHRCAIQTCRNEANVDVHHIVPWSKSKTHEPADLIALCPNCHRRADKGHIDRKSLRKYKLICQGLARPSQPDKTFLKFSPAAPTTILDASNISSLVDIGVGDVAVAFGKPFRDANYVTVATGNGSVSFKVIAKSKDSARIKFFEPYPEIVRLEFQDEGI
jgi:hypothetical protein